MGVIVVVALRTMALDGTTKKVKARSSSSSSSSVHRSTHSASACVLKSGKVVSMWLVSAPTMIATMVLAVLVV
jgi:hypothetical protein